MNDQEKATHIGEILMANNEGKVIQYKGEDCQPEIFDNLVETFLFSSPERYSIKKEPRTVEVRLYFDQFGEVLDSTVPLTKNFSSPVTCDHSKTYTITLED